MGKQCFQTKINGPWKSEMECIKQKFTCVIPCVTNNNFLYV